MLWTCRFSHGGMLLLLVLHRLVAGEDGVGSVLNSIIIALLGSPDSSYGDCKGCFCIPDDIFDPSACPTSVPRTDYSTLIPTLRALRWQNPISLDCDPYDEDTPCDTAPPLEEGGACVVEFDRHGDSECPDSWSYSLRTYAGTFDEALSDTSVVVTHASPCGVCSSLQDLSVYMEQGGNLTDKSTDCGFQGIVSKNDGIGCFKNLGFTEGCATVWYYNTRKTASECFAVCSSLSTINLPPNRLRDCELNRCLACDETKSGPIFKRFSGRTRRNSGLLSHIARPCSDIVPLEHNNPCDLSADDETSSGFRSTPGLLLWTALAWLLRFWLPLFVSKI